MRYEEASTSILISGGGGFLGSHVIGRLLRRTNLTLVTLVREQSLGKFIEKYSQFPNIVPVVAKLDQSYLDEVVKANNVVGVMHLATEYGRDGSVAKPIQTNLTLPVMMINSLIKISGLFFINSDSYFNKPGFSYPLLLNYSLSKKALLLWLQSQSELLDVSNVVLEHVYGPGDSAPKFVPTILEAARGGTLANIKITGGEQSRDWLFVEDAVSAFELILNRSLSGRGAGFKEYSVGTGYATSLRTFVEVVAQVFGSDIPIFGSRPYGVNEIWESYADLTALTDIGYHPKFSIRAGVERCLNAPE